MQHGVADQVAQDLLHSSHIGDPFRIIFLGGAQIDGDAGLFRHHAVDIGQVIDQVIGAETAFAGGQQILIPHHAAHIVHQRQELLQHIVKPRAQFVPVLRVIHLFGQHLQQGGRGAQFVADQGKQAVLAFFADLQLAQRFLQRDRGFVDLGDVRQCADGYQTILPGYLGDAVQAVDPVGRAVLPAVAIGHLHNGSLWLRRVAGQNARQFAGIFRRHPA